MRFLAFLAFLALAGDALAQGRFARVNSRCVGGRSDRGLLCDDYAFFELAPASGAGMGAPCACAAITGAKGEAVTMTRGSTATCSKQGLATTGIANGDLVDCSSNLPRVESSGGVYGLRVEGTRTNSIVRSEEIDNAAWIPQNGGGGALPVITANAATSPKNDLTAERVQISACVAGGSYSLVQSSGAVQSAAAGSLYVRGNGSSGSLGMSLFATGGMSAFLSCAYVSTSWTRCEWTGAGAAATTNIYFGCGNGIVGMTSTGAADVFVWGGDMEAGTHATSYIPTVAAAVTRSEDVADVALAFSPTAGMCLAATVEYSSLVSLPAGGGLMGPILTTGAAGTAITATYAWPYSTAAGGVYGFDTGGVMSAGVAFYQPGVAGTSPGRYLMRHPGGVAGITLCTNAACTTNGTTSTWGTPAFTRLKLDRATAAAGNAPQHIITRVQVDPIATRCTP